MFIISLSYFYSFLFFFFDDTATTEIYTLSLHDALPISRAPAPAPAQPCVRRRRAVPAGDRAGCDGLTGERAREGLLGRAGRDGRADRRVPQPRSAAASAEPRLGRGER